jgi:transcription elongation factor Elf1
MFGKKCPVCEKKMKQKEVWHAKESKFIKEWICLNCIENTRLQNTSNPTPTSGRGMWSCSICKNRFINHDQYLSHPCHFRS